MAIIPFDCSVVFFVKNIFDSHKAGMPYLKIASDRLESLKNPEDRSAPFSGLSQLLENDLTKTQISENLCLVPVTSGWLLGSRNGIPGSVLRQVWGMSVNILNSEVRIRDFFTYAFRELYMDAFFSVSDEEITPLCIALEKIYTSGDLAEARKHFNLSTQVLNSCGDIKVVFSPNDERTFLYTNEDLEAKVEAEETIGRLLGFDD